MIAIPYVWKKDIFVYVEDECIVIIIECSQKGIPLQMKGEISRWKGRAKRSDDI